MRIANVRRVVPRLGMWRKLFFGNTPEGRAQLRHWLMIVAVALLLVIAFFAWNSAAGEKSGKAAGSVPAHRLESGNRVYAAG